MWFTFWFTIIKRYEYLVYYDRELEDNQEEKQLLCELIAEELDYGAARLYQKSQLTLPSGLVEDIVDSICQESHHHPCGLRGCAIYFYLENDKKSSESQEFAKVRCDSYIVPTFEIHIVLERESSLWTQIVPQLIRSLSSTNVSITISRSYKLTLKKLFRN
ncbi:hypothetical protein QYM36_002603 [Artemia franciscana]|uniref:Uncharacterized protein n=1 Tax=Artemia franciscana TaxID=6661 RepID=A0AA88I6A7_ARTSF|nr:hypothetical protein QYM36_002603 [Artemia franciscana]